MRLYFLAVLCNVFMLSGSALAQYPPGIRSHFGGEFPRSGFYAPNILTINYGGVVAQGVPGLGIAGFGGEFANRYSYRYYLPPQPVYMPPPALSFRNTEAVRSVANSRQRWGRTP